MRKVFKFIKAQSLLIIFIFFVSGIVGPAWGWKGQDNEADYNIFIHKPGDNNALTELEKNKTYYFEILASRADKQITNLNVEVPAGFELKHSYSQKALLTNKEGRFILVLDTPGSTGEFYFLFKGNINNDTCDFKIPIKIEDKERAEFFEKEANTLFLASALIVGMSLFWLSVFGVIKH